MKSTEQIVKQLEETLQLTPLQILARATLEYDISKKTQRQLFGAYDDFLLLLDDEPQRQHLQNLEEEEASGDEIFENVRDIGHRFQGALTKMFFDENDSLRRLTRLYGVF